MNPASLEPADDLIRWMLFAASAGALAGIFLGTLANAIREAGQRIDRHVAAVAERRHQAGAHWNGIAWEPECVTCGCIDGTWARWHNTRIQAVNDAARQLEKRRNAA